MSKFTDQLSILIGTQVHKDNIDDVIAKMDATGKVDSKLMLRMVLLICKQLMEE